MNATDKLLQNWRDTGQLSYRLQMALHNQNITESLMDKVVFGDATTRDYAGGELYEILSKYAECIILATQLIDQRSADATWIEKPF